MPTLNRRDFLKSAGAIGVAMAAEAALARIGGVVSPVEAADVGQAKSPQLIPSVCGMCDAGCGILAYVQNGRLLKIEGNYNHSLSLGKICARGSAGVGLLYSEQRLKSPLKRTAGGRWEKVSWTQVLAEIGARGATFLSCRA